MECRNYDETIKFLRSENSYVQVLAFESQTHLKLGEVSGSWLLGESRGRCLGRVVWFLAEEHAMKLCGDWFDVRFCELAKVSWLRRVVVGAPKGRKGKKKQGQSAARMQSITAARESARARNVIASELGSVSEGMGRSDVLGDGSTALGVEENMVAGADRSASDSLCKRSVVVGVG